MSEGYAAAKEGNQPGFVRYLSSNEKHSVLSVVSCLKDKFGDRGAFVYFRKSEVCGAVAIDAAFALTRARQLLGVDGNGLNMIAENLEDGFMLDFNPDDLEGY